jgi:alpha-L-arabinofuranosidase
VNMDRFIETVVATADHVGAVRGSSKKMAVSFDEWNVWYQDRFENVDKITGIDNWPVAPRLLEDVYSVADAVVVGSLLASLLNHADRVTSASLAQLVNVIAPIMTEPGGIAWRQTTFFPFALTSALARGYALEVTVESDEYDTARYGSVPLVDAAASYDADAGAAAIFLVNRSQAEEATITVDLTGFGRLEVVEAQTLADGDPYAKNTLAEPDRVQPAPNASAEVKGATLTVTVPPVSWTSVALRVTA